MILVKAIFGRRSVTLTDKRRYFFLFIYLFIYFCVCFIKVNNELLQTCFKTSYELH